MPKIISLTEKLGWLKEYEEGKSVAQIAREHGHALQTIARGIEEARQVIVMRQAERELVKDTLVKHQNRLINEIDKLRPLIQIPSARIMLPWRNLYRQEIYFEGGKATVERNDELCVNDLVLDIERDSEWPLVRQHLKRDAFWRKYRQWQQAISKDLEARVSLKVKLSKLLMKNTDYEYADNPVERNFLYSAAVDLLFQQLTSRLLDSPGLESFEEKIWIDDKSGEIKYAGSTILAYARGEEKRCKAKIVAALDQLTRTSQARILKDTNQKTKKMTEMMKKEAEELVMAGMLPGKCRVCNRIGK